jgi:hypothetical protein
MLRGYKVLPFSKSGWYLAYVVRLNWQKRIAEKWSTSRI